MSRLKNTAYTPRKSILLNYFTFLEKICSCCHISEKYRLYLFRYLTFVSHKLCKSVTKKWYSDQFSSFVFDSITP